MPGLGSHERDLHRLGVADFAEQDHVGILPQRSPERRRERRRVEPDLALAHRALVVLVEKLDGVFDGDDVLRRGSVDVPDHRRQVELLPLPAAPTTKTSPRLR